MTVPDDLRNILEQCLAEEATPANLDIYLPRVRQIITNLLQGLRGKQSIYRLTVSDSGRRPSGHGRAESSSSHGEVRKSRGESGNAGSSRAAPVRNGTDSDSGPGRSPTTADSIRRRTPSTGRRKEPSSQSGFVPPVPSEGGDFFPGGFAPPQRRVVSGDERMGQTPSDLRQSTPPEPEVYPNPHSPVKRDDTTSIATTPVPPPDHDDPNDRTVTSIPQSPPPVPANVMRYSLIDPPMAPPSVVVEEASPTPSSENIADLANGHSERGASKGPSDNDVMQTPAMASHLAALKKSDALERRASKRFSTYNISKMTGSGLRERTTSSRTKRISMLADGSALTPGDLNVLTEVDESPSGSKPRNASRSKSSERSPTKRSRIPSPLEEESAPPIPPLPVTPEEPIVPAPPPKDIAPPETVVEAEAPNDMPSTPTYDARPTSEPATPGPSLLTVFLQVGRVVKKATIEPRLSYSYLRVLFVDKFSYNPGQDNFPAIYIRDPSSGVMYELEDVDEVKDKCLLSLNIERK